MTVEMGAVPGASVGETGTAPQGDAMARRAKDELLTIAQTAALIGYSAHTVRQRRGLCATLPPKLLLRAPGAKRASVRYSLHEIEGWIEAQKRARETPAAVASNVLAFPSSLARHDVEDVLRTYIN